MKRILVAVGLLLAAPAGAQTDYFPHSPDLGKEGEVEGVLVSAPVARQLELAAGSEARRARTESSPTSDPHSGDQDSGEALGRGAESPREVPWPRGLEAWTAAARSLGASGLWPSAAWLMWAGALAAFLLGAACRSRLDLRQSRRENAERLL